MQVLPWHLPYNWGKSTENPSGRVRKTSIRVRKTSVMVRKPSVGVQYTYYQNTHTVWPLFKNSILMRSVQKNHTFIKPRATSPTFSLTTQITDFKAPAFSVLQPAWNIFVVFHVGVQPLSIHSAGHWHCNTLYIKVNLCIGTGVNCVNPITSSLSM
jgi:hypothetical protein